MTKENNLFPNKKAWIRIAEAAIAMMILSSFMVVFISRQVERRGMSEDMYNLESLVLEEVTKDDMARNAVISEDRSFLASFIKERVPNSLDFNISICGTGEDCRCTIENECTPGANEVFSRDVLISSTLDDYNPKKLTLFVWVKGKLSPTEQRKCESGGHLCCAECETGTEYPQFSCSAIGDVCCGLCHTPTCNDGEQNQDETGVDCGGVCISGTESLCSDGVDNDKDCLIDLADNNCLTVLLLHMEGTDGSTVFTDSAKCRTVTVNGDAQIDTAQYKFGSSSDSSTSGYLTLPDSDDWNMGNGDFTIDFWARFTGYSGVQIFANHYQTDYHQWQVSKEADGSLYISAWDGGSHTIYLTSSALSWNNNQWYHIAFVKRGNIGYIFRDGQQAAADTGLGIMPDVASVLSMGGSIAGSHYYFKGWIDEFRISKGVARWTSNFAVPSAPYTEGSC